jgi:hypothetical protein
VCMLFTADGVVDTVFLNVSLSIEVLWIMWALLLFRLGDVWSSICTPQLRLFSGVGPISTA